jgi:uncharacterized membrane protein YbhN (UPF0104 family)
MATSSLRQGRLRPWRLVAIAVVLVVAVYVLSQSRQTIGDSFTELLSADLRYVLLAAGLTGCTFLLAAGMYQQLALRSLQYKRTVVVELAAACVNRLLPAGIASLGLHGLYLYKQKHTAAQATAVVSANNLLGMSAHQLVLVTVLVAAPNVVAELELRAADIPFGWVFLGAAGLGVVWLLFPRLQERAKAFGRSLLQSFRLIVSRPRHMAIALVLAVLLPLAFTAILQVCARAVGLELGFWQCFIVFSAGMLVGTVTPTPGGLVGAEAGLFAAFVAYGATAPLAGAAVLLFRLVAYWLPIVPGAAALWWARKQKYL